MKKVYTPKNIGRNMNKKFINRRIE